MIDKHDELYRDFSAVRKISIVPLMLDTVCRLTGLGFAAVARVTQNRWLACTVLDKVNFGLGEGEELKIETTLCNEIRDNHKAIVIDHVDADETYRDHHTPKLYGLQSYISFPIILKNGEFFGTLCAIGSQPALLNDPKITGTFKLFAELVSFHLQSIDLVEKSFDALQYTKQQLAFSHNENQHYQQISQHNFQEQIRKINLFTDILVSHADHTDSHKTKETAQKINASAKELSSLVKHISTFSDMSVSDEPFEAVDLNEVLEQTCFVFDEEKNDMQVTFENNPLPVVHGQPGQLQALFIQLVSYMVNAADKSPSVIKTSARAMTAFEVNASLPLDKELDYCELCFEYKHKGIEEQHLDNIFDIIIHSRDSKRSDRYEAGLAASRKIIQGHKGYIHASVVAGRSLTFKVALPVIGGSN